MIWTKKCNGFMAALSGSLVTTTGSFDSDFTRMASEYVSDVGIKETLLFEICHPNDPHIIPEKAGAYLIVH
jgi:hypothetical protein